MSQNIRQRARPALPPPLTDRRLPSSHGLHDRFVIAGVGRLTTTEFPQLGRINEALRGTRPLLAQTGKQPRQDKLTLYANGMLLKGTVAIDREGSSLGRRIDLELEFNATRFFRQRGHQIANGTDSSRQFVIGNKARSEQARLECLDGSDNALTEDQWRRAVFGDVWSRALTVYVSSAFGVIKDDLARVFQCDADAIQFPEDRLWLKQAEVYWEFAAPQAIDTAVFYGRDLQARTGRSTKVTEYTHNSLSFLTELNDTIALATYAKMPDRLRFEARYLRALGRTVRWDRVQGIVPQLMKLREHAAARIRAAVGRVPADHSSQLHAVPALLDLFASIDKAARGNRAAAQQATRLLLTARHIAEPQGQVSDDMLSRLVSAGVLQHAGGTRLDQITRYELVPRYAWVVDRLSAAFGLTLGGGWTALQAALAAHEQSEVASNDADANEPDGSPPGS